ncbi:hypothetical protein [Clostridium sp. AF27-5AA]|uniref:hypothetical protein n=1 Tax=Clostridium sp. AF27-5AA TaxID=2293008 RepID=UPI000E467B00|nr:hypothetical protein [Clostridium sp. AF27-5AA]RHQ34411.1 hypothetical protein DWY89_04605 [Clostridium sp. AF27-5AA]
MYPVSKEYQKAISESSRSFFWTGAITTRAGKKYTFGNKDIVKGSGYISRQCSGSSEIELGSVYAAELGISLFSDIDRYSLEDASITLSFHLKAGNETYEEVPMGIFYIAEANRKIKTLELKAYDAMLNLDKNFDKGLSSAFPYDFLSLLSKACHVELAQTKEEIEALTNGTELLGIYQENDIETWRDFLYYLAQALGCFSTIDREGKLRLIPYGIADNKTVDSRHRFSSTFSDFVTRYTAVSSTNKKTDIAEYYSVKPDDGLTMNLGVNPLLQFGLEEKRKRIINNILSVVTVVNYVPFDSDTIGDPALDLGDVIKFTGGHADETKRSAITSIETKINGKQKIKCVGKNPRLAGAKSKNDKNIAGLQSSMNENKLSIYTYVNALKINAGTEKTSIINIEFASGDETNAEFHAEVILDVRSNAVSRRADAETTIEIGEESKVISIPVNWTDDGKTILKAYYVLDGKEVEQFHPSETWFSGKHLLNLYYPIIEMKANELHTFEVMIELTDGTATIEPQNAMATISGQGLGAQERWDGRITVDEEIRLVELSGLPTNRIHDKAVAAFITPKKTGITQPVDSIRLTGLMVPEFYDNISFFVPIVRDVVETADKDKMEYRRAYVEDDKQFLLRKEYFLSGGDPIVMDRGRAVSLTVNTEPFQELTEIKILPFETAPFVNKHKVKADGLGTNRYTKLEAGHLVLVTDYKEKLTGTVEELDKGTVAVFDPGFDKFDEIEILEVHNG